jgi:hypothetical protein
VEHKLQVNWEEVTILVKRSNTRKRKIHEAAAMHIEDNVISQPTIDIPPLCHSLLRKENRKETKRKSHNNKVNKQDKRGMGNGKRERGNIERKAPRDQHSLSVKENQVWWIGGTYIIRNYRGTWEGLCIL